jgi:glutamyl-tRNA reductase
MKILLLATIVFTTNAMASTQLSDEHKKKRMDIIDANISIVILKTSEVFQKVVKGKYNNSVREMKEDLETKAKQMHQICKETADVNKCYTKNLKTLPFDPGQIPDELERALQKVQEKSVLDDLAMLKQEMEDIRRDELDYANDRFQQDMGSDRLNEAMLNQY